MKILQIVGARPQFIKYFPVFREINKNQINKNIIENILIHTGQHYDHGMSKIFFEELEIPEPAVNLGVGSGSHGEQTGEMLSKLEKALIKEKPDYVVIYGDTNSTLAGALAAAKLEIPIAHVEAGLRSYNRSMPEEINRVVADHLSDLLFCPTDTSVQNLFAEGITSGVHNVGDVMYDALLHFSSIAENKADVLKRFELEPSEYVLLTLHRPSNTDAATSLIEIISAVTQLGKYKFVFPAHPRTKKAIKINGLSLPQNLLMTEPVGYLDMITLEKNAAKVVTDSGGVQKEAYLFKVPCITLREETEWKETVDAGWNVLVGSEKELIVQAVESFQTSSKWIPFYGDGKAAEKIVPILLNTRQV